jgi:hypothetical protein
LGTAAGAAALPAVFRSISHEAGTVLITAALSFMAVTSSHLFWAGAIPAMALPLDAAGWHPRPKPERLSETFWLTQP